MSGRVVSHMVDRVSAFFSRKPVPLTALMLCAATLVAQAPPPVFRGGVDVVQVDVTVLDKDRKPVRGLTAADFTVYEDGKPRPILTFKPVDLPPPPPAVTAADAAPWTREVAPDVTSNAVAEEGRLVVILFDWSIRFEDQQSARKIATAAVNQLGPGDEAAVIFSSGFANAGTPQGFTSDRARLLEAINRPIAPAMHNPDVGPMHDPRNGNSVMLDDPEGYEIGDCRCRLCVFETVTRIADLVRDVSGRRKILMFVGTYFQGYESPRPNLGAGIAAAQGATGSSQSAISHRENLGSCAGQLDEAREKATRAMGLANLTVDTLDPSGLTTFGSDPMGGGPGNILLRQDNLHILPDITGGRTVVNTNAPEEMVPAIFEETQSYYLLAVERASANDGKRHDLEVKVKRPGVIVQYRKGYYATDAMAADAAPASATPLPKSLDRVLPRPDLPLTITAEPFATPGGAASASVAVIVGVREPAGTGAATEKETVLAAAFDAKGQSVSKAQQTMTVTLPRGGTGDATYDVFARLPAKPGRYEIRAAVDIAPDRRGTVYTYVDVPDFAKDALSLSGLLVGTAPSRPSSPPDLFHDVAPIVPTARRDFAAANHVTSFLHVYQGGSGTLAPVPVVTRIADTTGRVVASESVTLEPAQFGSTRAADYRYELPLTRLTPGAYLLRIDAMKDNAHVSRNVRFTVN